MKSRGRWSILTVAITGALVGCASEAPSAPPTTATAPPTALAPSAPLAAREPVVEPAPLADATELRDPFQRSTSPEPPPPIPLRRTRRFAVDDLRLIGVAGRGGDAHALLRDPTGRGWVVATGELVGRPETRGGVLTSWRVDRIREHDVVLALDATDGRAPVNRVLALPADPLIEAHD